MSVTDLIPGLVFPESKFVTCTVCEDYDLCIPCHVDMKHGHHPKHAFSPATEQVSLDQLALALCRSGRNVQHHAVCDGCDKVRIISMNVGKK